jgi:hypothetical protein
MVWKTSVYLECTLLAATLVIGSEIKSGFEQRNIIDFNHKILPARVLRWFSVSTKRALHRVSKAELPVTLSSSNTSTIVRS